MGSPDVGLRAGGAYGDPRARTREVLVNGVWLARDLAPWRGEDAAAVYLRSEARDSKIPSVAALRVVPA